MDLLTIFCSIFLLYCIVNFFPRFFIFKGELIEKNKENHSKKMILNCCFCEKTFWLTDCPQKYVDDFQTLIIKSLQVNRNSLVCMHCGRKNSKNYVIDLKNWKEKF